MLTKSKFNYTKFTSKIDSVRRNKWTNQHKRRVIRFNILYLSVCVNAEKERSCIFRVPEKQRNREREGGVERAGENRVGC